MAVTQILGLAGALLLLATLRPEGAAFVLLILVWRRSSRHSLPVTEIAFAVGFVSLILWRWSYFGSVLPNTFHAKMTGGPGAYNDGLHYLLDFVRHGGGGVLVGLALVPLLQPRRSRVVWLLLTAISLQVLMVLAAGGDWMQYYRFMAPALPLLAALLAAGLATIWKEISSSGADRKLAVPVLVIVLLAGYLGTYKYEREQLRAVLPALEKGGSLAQSYGRVGVWLEENSPPEARVAVSDIGAIGYFSHRRILDMFGLIDTHIARRPGRLHFKCDPQYLLDQNPDYIILVRGGDPTGQSDYLRIPDREMAALPEFHDKYRPIREMPLPFNGETVVIYQRHRTRIHG